MLRVTFVRITKAKAPRLRAWLQSLNSRVEELAESYHRQYTTQELFYLVEAKDDLVLMIVSESTNLRVGAETFMTSDLAIDIEFKAFIQDIGVINPPVELIFDSTDLLPLPEDPAESGEPGSIG